MENIVDKYMDWKKIEYFMVFLKSQPIGFPLLTMIITNLAQPRGSQN